MNNMPLPIVTFLEVSNSDEKLKRLIEVSSFCYQNNQALLIIAPSNEAATYIDRFLWRFSPLSFLPHEIAHNASTSPIAITTDKKNWNSAETLLNLSPQFPQKPEKFKKIFEFFDNSSKDHTENSRLQLSRYSNKGCPLERLKTIGVENYS